MKRILKIIIFNLIFFVLFLWVIDFFLFDKKEGSAIQRYITLREHGVLKNKNYSSNTNKGDKIKQYKLRTDEAGFIIGPGDELKSDSVDIIFFGGSTTECLLISEEERFPYLVGKKIVHNESGRKITTLNAGVSGNNSMHSFLNFLAKGIHLKPKIIVLMHNINDLSLLTKTGSYWIAPSTRSLLTISHEQEINLSEILQINFNYIYPNIYKKSKEFYFNQSNSSNQIDEWSNFRENKIIDYTTIEEQFERSILSFVDVASNYNIDLILMTQASRLRDFDNFSLPNFSKEEYNLLCEYHEKINDKIREIARKENLNIIDLEKQISPSQVYLYDHVHLNSIGSKFVADIIVENLKKNYAFLAKKVD